MDIQVHLAAICCVCKCSLHWHEPHAIVNHDYAHLDCADAYDSQDIGGQDLPPYIEHGFDDDSDFDEE